MTKQRKIKRGQIFLDKYYRGKKEMDWYDDADRIAMVKDGKFHCFEDAECPNCPAKQYCDVAE